MKRILIAAAAVAMAGAALAQQSSTGQSSGGPIVQRGPMATGSIVIPTERRAVIKQRFTAAPVTTVRERVVVGRPVPADVELMAVPETVVTEVPDFRSYRYFRWNNDVVLVDPATRQVVQIIE